MTKNIYGKLAFLSVMILAAILANFSAAIGRSTSGLGSDANAADLFVPQVVVVKFKDSGNLSKNSPVLAAQLSQIIGAEVGAVEPVLKSVLARRSTPARVGLERSYFVHFRSAETPMRVAQRLATMPEVEYAEPKRIYHLNASPNDPDYSRQTFFQVIQASQAWDVVKAEQGQVTIAIVDGGTDINHPDLLANLWTNPGEVPGNRLDDDGNGYVDDVYGWNFANDGNNPTGLVNTPDNANHGTHTAGLAAAVTNNEIGVAGSSWNARLMAINVGSPNNDNSVIYGYEGIIYAAESGADIISASWGSQGNASVFEQEVIQYVTELGVIVVAAAGNNNNAAMHYPSSYRNVFSVTATSNGDQKISFSNYGASVDISAPGLGIRSTLNNGSYGEISGTSMATPLVAGAVALVKTLHPEWSGIQAAEQVRVTADNIDAKNPGYAGLLGYGRLNAVRAVTETSPAIRIANITFTETNGDNIIQPGESVHITVTLINYLQPATNIVINLVSTDPFVTLSRSEARIGAMTTLETVATTPFQLVVDSNTPSGYPIQLGLRISAGTYQDRDQFSLTVLPTFGNVSINNIGTTITNIGRIGFLDPENPTNGLGFRYQNGASLLFEGALMVGTGSALISNAARGVRSNALVFDQDFEVETDGDLQISTPGAVSDQESRGIFNDAGADVPLPVRISQETFAFKDAPNADFILFRYTVENQNALALDNFHLGVFFDWDIDGGSFSSNKTSYDSLRRLGYAYDTGNGPDTFVGMSVLSSELVHYRAIYNDENDSRNPSWGLYDGFTDEEKWQALSGGVVLTEAGPADISFVIGTGPYTIPANGAIRIGFALLAGNGLESLQAHADAAQTLWNSKFVSGIADAPSSSMPAAFALAQNYPNPFNPGTSLRYQIPQSVPVEIKVFNALGQPVRILVQALQPAGTHLAQWDGLDTNGNPMPSGIYWFRLQAGAYSESRKMLLLR